jgi:hypothetical protein
MREGDGPDEVKRDAVGAGIGRMKALAREILVDGEHGVERYR